MRRKCWPRCAAEIVVGAGPRLQLADASTQHENPDGGREITALGTLLANRVDQIGEGHSFVSANLLQADPEKVLDADAHLVAADDDRSFDNG